MEFIIYKLLLKPTKKRGSENHTESKEIRVSRNWAISEEKIAIGGKLSLNSKVEQGRRWIARLKPRFFRMFLGVYLISLLLTQLFILLLIWSTLLIWWDTLIEILVLLLIYGYDIFQFNDYLNFACSWLLILQFDVDCYLSSVGLWIIAIYTIWLSLNRIVK